MNKLVWEKFTPAVLQEIPCDEMFFIKGTQIDPIAVNYEWEQGRWPNVFTFVDSGGHQSYRFRDEELGMISHYARLDINS